MPPEGAVTLTSAQPHGAEDVQKKISLLSHSSTIAGELFPHYDVDSSAPTADSTGGKGGGGSVPRNGSGLVVVASMVSKVPNQGGEAW